MADPLAPCLQCGERFQPARSNAKHCSAVCRERYKYAHKKADGRYDLDLARKREAYQPRERQPATAKPCSERRCDRPHWGRGMCRMHYRRWNRRQGNEHTAWDDKARDKYHRRRARMHGGRNGDPVLLTALAERDHGCPRCGQPIDLTLTWPHPMSRSIDHIVPLSRGGAHSPDNTQLMHLRCNTAKGARLEHADPGGMPLIG